MKLTTSVLILALTGIAMAQPPQKESTTSVHPAKPAAAVTGKPVPAKAEAKPAATKPVVPVTQKIDLSKPATASKPAAAPKPAAVKQEVKPAAKPAAAAPAKVKVAVPAKKAAAKAEKKTAVAPEHKEAKEITAAATGRKRDPFVSVVQSRDGGPAPCAGTGKKCLIPDQVALKGIVRAPSGPIAVITSAGQKTYFLRENDPVYNGYVVKITADTVVFRETVIDRLGKSTQREVVKKVTTPAV